MAITWNSPKFDAHVHFNTNRSVLLEYGKDNNMKYLSINTFIPFFDSLATQESIIWKMKQKYGNQINYVSSFPLTNWGNPNWEENTINQLKESLAHGAIGIKVWKNIGMALQNSKKEFIGIDHASFDGIFDFLEENDIVVLGHIGEPKNCWLPLQEMTVEQDRKYFAEHPEYHMYLHPEAPSYEAHLEARNKRLLKNPNLRYVGLHLGSQEWNSDEVADFLDQFPLAAVDLGERICHLQHQASTNWHKIHCFMIKYQDRIIYGSDVIDDNSLSDQELVDYMDKRYKNHWKFFTATEEMDAPKVTGRFKGLGLSDAVVKKIYYDNAAHWYGLS